MRAADSHALLYTVDAILTLFNWNGVEVVDVISLYSRYSVSQCYCTFYDIEVAPLRPSQLDIILAAKVSTTHWYIRGWHLYQTWHITSHYVLISWISRQEVGGTVRRFQAVFVATATFTTSKAKKNKKTWCSLTLTERCLFLNLNIPWEQCCNKRYRKFNLWQM